MYAKSRTGISPEIIEFRGGNDFTPGAPYYLLRPETVETFFYMWRFTKDVKWRNYAWEMLTAIMKYEIGLMLAPGERVVLVGIKLKSKLPSSFPFAPAYTGYAYPGDAARYQSG